MILNPNNATHATRISRALEHYFKKLRPMREKRSKLVQDYAGSLYGDETPKYQIIANMMLQTAKAYTTALASRRPQFYIETWYTRLRGFALHYQANLNVLAEIISLEETTQPVVLDSFFGPGFIKYHRKDAPPVVTEDDHSLYPGFPAVSRISPDDVAYDVYATDWRNAIMIADRRRISWESLQDSDLYDQKAVKQVPADSKYYVQHDEEFARDIAFGVDTDHDEPYPMVEVCDVWLNNNMLVTWPCDRKFVIQADKPLRIVDNWDDPDPYDMLNLGPVPDNTLPTSPAENVKALFDLTNTLLRKADRQARRARDIPIYEGDAEQSVENLRKARDGMWTKVDRRESVDVLKLGGVDQAVWGFYHGVKSLYNEMAGNPTGRLGIESGAPTATQEQMMAGNMDETDAELRHQVDKFVERIGYSLGQFMHNDPELFIPAEVRVPNIPYPVESNWNPEYRMGELFDYRFKVTPYSMSYQSPRQKADKIMQLVTQLYIPMMQMGVLDAQGIRLNLAKLGQELAYDLGRWDEVVESGLPTLPQVEPNTGGSGGAPLQSPVTTRNYQRFNVPTGGTPQRQSMDAQTGLMGGNGDGRSWGGMGQSMGSPG